MSVCSLKIKHGLGIPAPFSGVITNFGQFEIFLRENRTVLILRQKYGYTPLMIAAQFGYLAMTNILLDNREWRETMNLRNKDGWTALMIASVHNQFDIVHILNPIILKCYYK